MNKSPKILVLILLFILTFCALELCYHYYKKNSNINKDQSLVMELSKTEQEINNLDETVKSIRYDLNSSIKTLDSINKQLSDDELKLDQMIDDIESFKNKSNVPNNTAQKINLESEIDKDRYDSLYDYIVGDRECAKLTLEMLTDNKITYSEYKQLYELYQKNEREYKIENIKDKSRMYQIDQAEVLQDRVRSIVEELK